MSKRSQRPFEQAPLSRRERRAAERRAAERAAARAEAMPPPDPTTRVDVTGLHQHPPAEQQPTLPASPWAAPQQAPAPAQQAWPTVPSAPVPQPSPPAPTVVPPTVPTVPAASYAPQPFAVPGLPAQAPVTDPSDRPRGAAPNVLMLVRSPWVGQWARGGLIAGALACVAGFGAALGWGAPVLDHPTQWRAVAIGVGVLLAGLGAMSRGWAHGGLRLRRATAAAAALLVAAFGTGVATNPVVVDGHVFLSTSKEAQEYRMMRQVRDDLTRMGQLDAYLTYSAADAGAHYNEYAPALDELTRMSTKYAGYTPSNLPDAAFVDTVAAMKSAAYWEEKAMESKIELLDQDDARYADDVQTNRANFAQQYSAAGRSLSFLSADLNIPIDTREHE